ncbi:hypothetical protein HMPREF3216_00642 [Gardnerella vaginalis]|uniref:Uncharacterized protein n=2 Tax=Gardnerella TaxID=2701 RepID=A0A133NPY6_GARVA|nr:hypothetical protein HMPREF3216_00642 [Gardnerella vaginalis]
MYVKSTVLRTFSGNFLQSSIVIKKKRRKNPTLLKVLRAQTGRRAKQLLLTLMTSLTQQFAVLLLAHPLAALLDDRTHLKPPFICKVCNLPNVTPF